MSLDGKRAAVERDHELITVERQCELLGLNRSSYYYREKDGESFDNLTLMRLIDEEYTRHPFYGSRKFTNWLNIQGYPVNRKRVVRLMGLLGLKAIYPEKKMRPSCPAHKKYPYLLRGVAIEKPNHVWSTDITYIRLQKGFVYLCAVIDWYSRYVLSWRLSTSLETSFCLEALDIALRGRTPKIFNTDQGVQFTNRLFTDRLERDGILVSMDGRGRALDNVFIERLWRTVKYEEVYLKDYRCPLEVRESLGRYFEFYNHQRLHQSLDYRTPAEVYAVQ